MHFIHLSLQIYLQNILEDRFEFRTVALASVAQ